MRFSILHISDLHRDLKDEIPNNWLLDSLSHDFDRFDTQDPKILKPSICIVSGDLVYGASTNPENADAELRHLPLLSRRVGSRLYRRRSQPHASTMEAAGGKISLTICVCNSGCSRSKLPRICQNV